MVQSRKFYRSCRVAVVLLAVASAPVCWAETSPPPDIQNATAEEFPVEVNGATITVRVLSPPADKLAEHPALLLTFALDRIHSLATRPYCLTAEYFLAQGHRAASFDLPAHGDRIGQYGDAISGMRNEFVAGHDPFAAFADEGQAVVSECIKRGLATAGHIAVAGTSRGGYMALRLLAGDERIAAGAGFAPVTDWRALTEFAEDKDREDVRDLQLINFVSGMVGKPVFVVIGKTDTRVGTECCTEFANALKQANADTGRSADLVTFRLTEDSGHSVSDQWYEEGRALLLKAVTVPAPSP